MDKTTITTYAASGAGFLTGMTTNEKVAVASVVIALGTFVLNWIYKHMHYRLAQKAANLKAQGKG
ncbi:holin [Thalassospira indica]|uniref:Holin n=1 Tax=Thalassospira indica TaxID=1891279 RepID=A0ABM6Y085_9PROT|nr:HP1 family phage holin [Thalassospira indica]AXO13780.1 hypothetical protein DY252_05740 [Thalassospira indica]OAZ14336.1 hypothetical protein TH15_00475 [Thalassospira profundimaris]|tara:strand:- start:4797 stop:4991 length:195 start_codon:yes stop_codon:yes gene_type:complete